MSPRKKRIRKLYALSAGFYDLTRKPFLRGREEALKKCAARPGERILEIGCGTGEMLGKLARAAPGLRAAGMDLSGGMLARARGKLPESWSLVLADAESLPFARVFDCILYSYSLSVLDDWPISLARAVACLKDGGRLVVLDFGEMAGLGPFRWVVRGWMALHGVRVVRGLEGFLGGRGMDVESTKGPRGWWKVVLARLT